MALSEGRDDAAWDHAQALAKAVLDDPMSVIARPQWTQRAPESPSTRSGCRFRVPPAMSQSAVIARR